MAYPDEIIAALAGRFELSEIQQVQLRESLTVDGVQSAIEDGFDPANLIILLEMPDAPPYISVLSPVIVQQLIADLALLDNPDVWLEWNRIKYEIDQLKHIRRSAVAERRRVANEILKRIEEPVMSDYIRSHSSLLQEFFDISKELRQHANARVEPIDAAATAYFTDLFAREDKAIVDIVFRAKYDGVQLGRILRITYNDLEGASHEIDYYIKTHQHGSLAASRSGSVANIDLKELFVYKVLEYVGYGPKTHYFFNPLSPGGFFIATQDAGFTKVPDKEKKFEVFDRIVGGYEATHDAAEHDGVRRDIIALDMISRILRISDTTPNPGNYGRVTVIGGERTKWKLLDFRIQSEPDIAYLRREIFEDFCCGNGVFNYDAKAFFMGIFRDPSTERRKFAMAHDVVMELRSERKMPLLDAIHRAYKEVHTYAEMNNESLRLDLGATLIDFHRYFEAVQANFEILAAGIEERYATFTVDAEEVAEEAHATKPK